MMAIRCFFLWPLLTVCCISFAQGTATFQQQLSQKSLSLTQQKVVYDPAYVVLKYPMGDVPAGTGVCTDVVIRAYRLMDIDLQKAVHEDMKAHFSVYPQKWGLKRPDKNIDHRRVPNLMTFFARHGKSLPLSQNPKDYLPGDIVCWRLSDRLTHIGLVMQARSIDGKRHLILHNIGGGQVLSDCLFEYEIIGHYRYGGL